MEATQTGDTHMDVNTHCVNEAGLIKVETRLLCVLDDRIAEMAKVAKRYQFPVPTYTIVGYDYSTTDENVTAYAIVKINDVDLRFAGGWQFVAVVDHTTAGNVVRTAPQFADDTTLTTELATVAPTCDHCGTTRQRTKTIVVKNDEGDTKRIGGQCAKTFLGRNVTLSQAMMDYFIMLDRLAEMTDDEGFSGLGASRFSVMEVLATASAVIRVYGYTKETEFAPGTKGRVSAYLMTKHFSDDVKVVVADYTTAEQTVNYLTNLEATSLFESNVKVAVMSGNTKKHFGLIVWAVEMYRRSQIVEAPQAEAQGAVELKPVVEGRITITGEVVRLYSRESDYGVQFKMIVLDDRGFKVCGTQPASLDVNEGDRVEFVATVEASPSDNTFGFYKRPSKAQALVA
jgi:hypothetical protein